MTELCVIDVPYDCGRFNARAGAGPTALLQGGLVAALESTGLRVDRQSVRLNDRFHHEWSALASIQRRVATMVRGAADRGVRALILSGNCGPAVLGAVGALGGDRTGVVWFDAHADLNTPDTSPSGFLDGMGLAMAMGRGWPAASARLDLPRPLRDDHVVLVGARDLDEGERQLLKSTPAIECVGTDALDALPPVLSRLPRTAAHVYVHVDMDVLDVGELRANSFATTGGLTEMQLRDAITAAGRCRPMAAGAVTSLDPTCDARAVEIATRVAVALATA